MDNVLSNNQTYGCICITSPGKVSLVTLVNKDCWNFILETII